MSKPIDQHLTDELPALHSGVFMHGFAVIVNGASCVLDSTANRREVLVIASVLPLWPSQHQLLPSEWVSWLLLLPFCCLMGVILNRSGNKALGNAQADFSVGLLFWRETFLAMKRAELTECINTSFSF